MRQRVALETLAARVSAHPRGLRPRIAEPSFRRGGRTREASTASPSEAGIRVAGEARAARRSAVV
jgi:hypothetical protein